MELTAIVSEKDNRIVWAGMADLEEAEHKAIIVAINSGNCRLLTGEDLAMYLLGAESMTRLAGAHTLAETWKPGDLVELDSSRPGVVERIEHRYGYHEHLVIRFDDGEVQSINPDVARHRH